jgi:hypothetical protein
LKRAARTSLAQAGSLALPCGLQRLTSEIIPVDLNQVEGIQEHACIIASSVAEHLAALLPDLANKYSAKMAIT